jgi:hypothetical protein
MIKIHFFFKENMHEKTLEFDRIQKNKTYFYIFLK